jgi:hypothetical protein
MSSEQQRPPDAAIAPEREPLPPLPDGGLARVMPDWLRDEPAAEPSPASAIDPADLVTADDLPDWLRQLGPEPLPLPAPPAPPTPPSGIVATVSLPNEQPVTLAVPTAPPRAEPPPAVPELAPTLPRDPEIVAPSVPPQSSGIATPATPPSASGTARRKAIVAVLGVLLLALVVALYVYARGGL